MTLDFGRCLTCNDPILFPESKPFICLKLQAADLEVSIPSLQRLDKASLSKSPTSPEYRAAICGTCAERPFALRHMLQIAQMRANAESEVAS